MKYILLFAIYTNGAGGISAEFDSLEACQNALEIARKEVSTYTSKGVCVPKSLDVDEKS